MKNVSAYRVAIDQTTKTIEMRARNFRNLLISVIALLLGTLLADVLTWSLLPLAGALLVVPVCGFFFLFDQKLLTDWRSRLIEEWMKKRINFSNFCDAMSAIPTLPKTTLQGMLATLPSVNDLIAEQGMSCSTREAIAAAVSGIHACQSDVLALKATAAAIGSATVVISAASHMWKPLIGGLILFFVPIFKKWMKRKRIEVLKQKTFTARTNVDFSNEAYGQLVARLKWNPISMADKKALMAKLESGRR